MEGSAVWGSKQFKGKLVFGKRESTGKVCNLANLTATRVDWTGWINLYYRNSVSSVPMNISIDGIVNALRISNRFSKVLVGRVL